MIVRCVTGLRRLAVAALSLLVRGYRYAISPLLPPSCRFYPSCSEYALQALDRHGPLVGTGLALWRLCRCHPFNAGGVDPVPPAPLRLGAGGGRWPSALRPNPADKD